MATPRGCPPFRGIPTGWRSGQRGIPRSSARGRAKPCTWGEAVTGTSAHWSWPAGKQLGRKGPGGPGKESNKGP